MKCKLKIKVLEMWHMLFSSIWYIQYIQYIFTLTSTMLSICIWLVMTATLGALTQSEVTYFYILKKQKVQNYKQNLIYNYICHFFSFYKLKVKVKEQQQPRWNPVKTRIKFYSTSKQVITQSAFVYVQQTYRDVCSSALLLQQPTNWHSRSRVAAGFPSCWVSNGIHLASQLLISPY